MLFIISGRLLANAKYLDGSVYVYELSYKKVQTLGVLRG